LWSPCAGADRRARWRAQALTPQTHAVSAADRAGTIADPSQPTGQQLLALVLSSLEDDKAEDVVQIDLHGKSSIGDYMVIASGRSTRQVASIADKLIGRIKDAFGMTARVEGKETGDWVLVDAGDVIVHVFRPEVRDFYQLEKMWMPAPGTAPA
jgi:ribosome-associated protein